MIIGWLAPTRPPLAISILLINGVPVKNAIPVRTKEREREKENINIFTQDTRKAKRTYTRIADTYDA